MLYTGEKYMTEEAEKIMKALKQIDTPSTLERFEEAIVRYMECKEVDMQWDENPYVKREIIDEDIEYRREYHIDTLVCDDKQFYIEAEYEFYDLGYTFIVHSFKILNVSEKKHE